MVGGRMNPGRRGFVVGQFWCRFGFNVWEASDAKSGLEPNWNLASLICFVLDVSMPEWTF